MSTHGRAGEGDGAAALAGGRYRTDAILGRGGMGAVYAVTDLASGRRLALKRIHEQRNVESGARIAAEQLRREYELLSELSHPSIIQVYDYGVDAQGPFYTMELLSGPSLADRDVIDYREACELMRDVASSLSVIHARRLVHRDVTLRNIHCAEDGRCKLLDFGAVLSMGFAKALVGTPAYLAPEAHAGQPLDGRADLFALGAGLYRLLTGRHAFPATCLAELPAHWATPPPAPHDLNPAVPAALGQLVLALLSFDPLMRPSSAAEVIERLSAIAGRELRESVAVRRAYLATPALVGRERALSQVRSFLECVAEQRGGRLWIAGEAGTGRTRMLEACAIQARLAGVLVASTPARDPQDAYGVIRGLLGELWSNLPDYRSDPSWTQISELLESSTADPGSAGKARAWATPEQRRLLHERLAQRLCALARERPLLFCVDDIDRADEPSLALLGALGQATEEAPLLLAFTCSAERPKDAPAALEWLARAAKPIALDVLSRAQVVELLVSVFGDIPNVRVLSERLHAISGGQPRWVMQLAAHLVERGAVRYEAGAFIVREPLAVDDLPSSMQATVAALLASVSPTAYELAQAFMLEPDMFWSAEELIAVCPAPPAELRAALAELVAAGILQRDHTRFGLGRRAIGSALLGQVGAAARACWHERLARVFRERGDAPREAQHLWAAGQEAAAVAVLVRFAHALAEGMRSDPTFLDHAIVLQPPDFMATLTRAVEACRELGCSKSDELMLRFACVRIGVTTFDGLVGPQLFALIDDLRVDAGLVEWDKLAHIEDPLQRILRALQLTEERRQQLPERERGFAVADAIRVLVLVVGHAVGVAAESRDPAHAPAIPSLAPLFPLSPALRVVEDMVQCARELGAGHYRAGIARARRMLEELAGEAGAAMEPSGRRYLELGTMFTLGLIAAERAQDITLHYADALEKELMFELSAWRLRMCYHRARGNAEEAERCRQKAEFLRIQNRPHHFLGGSAMVGNDLLHFASVEDLLGVKRVVDELSPIVERFPHWAPVLATAKGEYARLRGDDAGALASFLEALAQCTPESGLTWSMPAAGHVGRLWALGRREEARERARAYVAIVRELGIREAALGLFMWAALIEAAFGNAELAIQLADEAVEDHRMDGIVGVHAAISREVRARVSLLLGDRAGFEEHLAPCAEFFRQSTIPAMHGRLTRLLQDAREAGFGLVALVPEPGQDAADFDGASLERRLRDCAGPEQRAATVLELLSRRAGASDGALYLAREGTMGLRAVIGQPRLSASGESTIKTLLGRTQDRQVCERTITAALVPDVTADAPLCEPDAGYRSFLLACEQDGEAVVVGVAVLRLVNGRRQQLSYEAMAVAADALLACGDATPLRLSAALQGA